MVFSLARYQKPSNESLHSDNSVPVLDSELPDEIIGKIIDQQTAQPVDEAKVIIKTSGGVDITRPGGHLSDSSGIFIIYTQRVAHWGDILVINRKDCPFSHELSLSKSLELAPEYRPPMFASKPLVLVIKVTACQPVTENGSKPSR